MTKVTRQQSQTQQPCSLPSVEQLLVEGGDARIAIDPLSGLNKYGCPPYPDPHLLSFGSSTASVISEPGFTAANLLRSKLLGLIKELPHETIYARELHRIRSELLQLCDVSDIPGIEVVFASSGTDLHLIAAQYASSSESLSALAVMVGASETGSSVMAALTGHHFSSRSSLGYSVIEGSPISGAGAVEVANVSIRHADGTPKLAADIDIEVESLVVGAVAAGRRVLLILVDQSKTGLIAPSPACVAALKLSMPDRVDVFVDACQFRIAPPTLRAYLEQNFMVALTGSKFFVGPTYSAALLIPSATAEQLKKRSFPIALSAYSSRADWAENWTGAEMLVHAANFGLLLRWEVALQVLRAFRSVPQDAVTSFLKEFAHAIQHRLMTDPVFDILPVPHLNRLPLIEVDSWDQYQTIFPFLLFYPENKTGRVPLSREETFQIYRWLQVDMTQDLDFEFTGIYSHIASLRCQLGQPVACGIRGGAEVSALRMCVSAQMIVEAASREGEGAAAIIKRALAVLDKTALLVLHGNLKPI